MPWCKKNKFQLQKPEKNKASISADKYMKTETLNTKTVRPSSSWSSASSSTSLPHKKKNFHRKLTKAENLNKYLDLLNDATEITSFRANDLSI